MVGTSLDERGGVAAVLRTWRDNGLFERCSVHFLPTNGGGGPARKLWLAIAAWFKAAWWLSAGRVKVIHVHTSSYASFWRKTPFIALAMLLQRALIISLHGGAFKEFYATRSIIGRAWIRLVLRRCRRFIVLTPSWQDWVKQIEPSANTAVIPNAVNIGPPDPLHAAEPDLLLFLGRIEADKGIDILLRALAAARLEGAGWRLVCGGEGEIDTMRSLAKQLAIPDDALHFAGWLEPAAKQAWLQRCSLVVLPSLIENMPVSVIEAFAAARPVIATRVGGLPDMITPGVNGWLVEPGNVVELAEALILAHVGAGHLARMGTAARGKAQAEYDAKALVYKMQGLYDDFDRKTHS